MWMILLLGFGFGGLAFVGSKLIDVNLFSLNAMYANRLIRCYLGASRQMGDWQRRWVDVPRDMTVNAGEPSVSLGASAPGARPEPGDRFRSLRRPASFRPAHWRHRDGPPRILGAASAGQHDAQPGRRHQPRPAKPQGGVVPLSPLYCGAKGVGYVKIDAENPDVRANLTLGRAISISGAAVDPNMSFYQSPALTALLAVFNARLGSWMQNPRTIKEKRRKRAARTTPKASGRPRARSSAVCL